MTLQTRALEKRVLVIDDDPELCGLITMALEKKTADLARLVNCVEKLLPPQFQNPNRS